MKKLIIYGLIICLLFAVVTAPESLTVKESEQQYYYSVDYAVGWQLIPSEFSQYASFNGAYGVNLPVFANTADNTDWHNDAIRYTYFPALKKYIGVNGAKEEVLGGTMDDYSSAVTSYIYAENKESDWHVVADWYYFDKPRTITWNVIKDTNSYVFRDETPSLKKGWNLIFVPVHVLKDELNWGNCNFEKVYGWDGDEQEWVLQDSNILSELSSSESALAFGWAVKMTSDCTMSLGSVSMPSAPPAIPN